MNIEDDLHRALARKPAPPDFADRVMTRIEAESGSMTGGGMVRRSGAPRPRTAGRYSRWLATAAALVLVAGGGARYYEQQRQAAEAERVKQEIRVALQITSDVLARAQTRIQESGNRR